MTEPAQPRLEAATASLAPFVPRIAVDWLRDEPSVRLRTVEGTLVFADVSGFTDLTERLARRGREGAEEITRVLDAAFTELIGAAYAHDADLLKFGGDAVLLLVRGDAHAERAATAAVAMRDALAGMRRLATSAGPVRLEISIGVHSGAFQLFLVGGPHRELVVAGAEATTCLRTEAVAGAGEIALSASTAALLDGRLLGDRRDGVVLLADSPRAERRPPPFFDVSGVDLSRLMPAAYVREILGAPADPEHRHVAVAFLELRGTDELLERDGPESLAAALDERIASIQETCADHDVTFAQTDVSKGAVKVILLAGAPRSAGGEEEELLLRATSAIAAGRERLPVAIGVNAGRVYVGVVGARTRRTYTFYGDAINTAARVMAHAADGQLLALDDVLGRARTTYATTRVEPFAAKGKAEPVRATAVGAPSGERTIDVGGPFVGREAELSALTAAWHRARAGSGALVVVTGDPGIGKTRVVGELLARIGAPSSVRVQCSQGEANQPYSAVAALLVRAMRLDPRPAADDLEHRLHTAVRAHAELEPWLPLLGLVVGLDLPDTPETAALDERFVQERIAAVVETLVTVLVGDAVVVVDDAHLADPASAELLTMIATGPASRRWLLVLVRRPGDGAPRPSDVAGATTVPLGVLDRAASRELVLHLTEDAPLPAYVVEAIAERSAGSPLFARELVAAVGAGAALETLPSSIEALMARQIDELDAADRAVLRQASVLGTRFGRDTLTAVLGLDAPEADAVLARLGPFLATEGVGGIRFRNALLRDAAYEGLSFGRRRRLHRSAGESLERAAGDDRAPVAGRLAHHFFEAGVWGKALGYGTIAGRTARERFANVDAARLFERALAAGTRWRSARPEAVIGAAEALGDVRLSLGELEQARAAYVVGRRRVRGDAVERARLLRKEANVAYRLGAHAQARRTLTVALDSIAGVVSVPAAVQRARIEAQLGIVELWRGRPRRAAEWLRRAIADGEPVDARKALAHAFAGLDLAEHALGDGSPGVHSRRALEIYDALGDLVSKGGVLNNLGAIAYFAGRWNEALELYREAREAWERAGDTRSVSMASFNIGEILSGQGRLDEAEPLLRDAERASRAAGGSGDIAESLLETGLLSARRGDAARALDLLAEARLLLADAESGQASLLLEARTADAHALAGEGERAAELAAAALARATDEESAAVVRPVLYRVLGQAQLLAGRHDLARDALESAVVEADRVEHRYEEAQALDALLLLPGGRTDARVARRDVLFEQLGIVALPTPWSLSGPAGGGP